MPQQQPPHLQSVRNLLCRWFLSLLHIHQAKPAGPTPSRVREHLLYVFGQMRSLGWTLPLGTALAALAGSLVPLIVGITVDRFIVPAGTVEDWEPINFVLLVCAAFVAPAFVTVLVKGISILLMQVQFATLMKRHIHMHLRQMSWRFYQNEFAGRIGSKVETLGNTSTDLAFMYVEGVVFVTITALSSLAILAYASWWLFIPLALWAVCYVAAQIFILPSVQRLQEQAFEARSTMNGQLIDTYTNIQTAMLFDRSDREDPLVLQAMDEHVSRRLKAHRWVFLLDALMTTLNLFLLGSLFILSFVLWQRGMATAGAVAMVLPIGIRITDVSRHITGLVEGIVEDTADLNESLKTIAAPPDMVDVEDAAALVVSEGRIAFEDVGFAYEGNRAVIEGLGFEVKPGEKIALVGPSGAGKTSVTSLLLRLYDLTRGRILIDGQDIARVDRNSLRQQIAMVTQDTSLLHRSVAENIRYGTQGATQADIEDAARRAGALDFILGLRDNQGRQGFDAMVGERGVKLSGGQRQRVALARVLLKDAPIVVFDEATSALDSETEALLQDQLELVSARKTVLTIAHRLSTIQKADRIFVMDEGRIVQEGTHGALIAQPGLYAELWVRQAGGFLA